MRIPEKHKFPMFLDLNRDEKEKLQQYAKENLHELSIELMSEYIHETVIPIIWLKLLGFRYEPKRKGYYVDGHKKPKTISYRNKYTERYLLYEHRMYR